MAFHRHVKHFAMASISKGSSLIFKSRVIILERSRKSEAIPPTSLRDMETSRQTDRCCLSSRHLEKGTLMPMVGNVVGLLWLDEKPLLSEDSDFAMSFLSRGAGIWRNHVLREKCRSVTASGCAKGGNIIPLVFPVKLLLI